jgi:hypothetical protein
MKKFTLLFALLALSALTAYGQEAKGGQVLVESQAPKKEKEEKKTPLTPPKPTSEILGKPIVYGGYFTDLVRAEKKRALFDLKAPLDPQKDSENLLYYPGTEKVDVVVLFSIKF